MSALDLGGRYQRGCADRRRWCKGRDIEVDDAGEPAVADILEAELDAHVDHGHVDATELDDAPDEGWGIGDMGDELVSADLLDAKDSDAVLLEPRVKAANSPDWMLAAIAVSAAEKVDAEVVCAIRGTVSSPVRTLHFDISA